MATNSVMCNCLDYSNDSNEVSYSCVVRGESERHRESVGAHSSAQMQMANNRIDPGSELVL